jgi:hypothetical protein
MSRHERREKERELKKRKEKLRKEQEKLRSEASSQSRLKRIGRGILGKTVWLIGAGLVLLGGYAVARPHVSVEPNLSLNPVDPYTTQFTVRNENSIFEVHAIHCVCWPRRMESGHGFSVLSFAPLPYMQHTIPTLGPGISSTVDCPSAIGGLGRWSGEVEDAELEIVVSYNQSWWPFGVTERNAFTAKKDSQHGVHWVHITPAEEKPILPK